jgi:SAM-dependent methyltransferase
VKVIWHDLECGGYVEDVPLWRSLAESCEGRILDVGAGTGRVSLDLARRGHAVTALDRDAELLAELERRADGLDIETVVADARQFELDRRFRLCLVPMQTIQLLGGARGRRRFLGCAKRHLDAGGLLAVAISAELELFIVADGVPALIPDMCERDGVVYSSYPTAVREDGGGFVLERLREAISPKGERRVWNDSVRLDPLTTKQLEQEAADAGFTAAGVAQVAPTEEYSGSQVVMLRA